MKMILPDNPHDISFLIGQLISIAAIGMFIIFLLGLYYRKRYGMYYAIMRFTFHNDGKPISWFRSNPVYFYYLTSVACLILTEAGLIQQIADGTVYTKPVSLFFGSFGFVVSIIMILLELIRDKAHTTQK